MRSGSRAKQTSCNISAGAVSPSLSLPAVLFHSFSAPALARVSLHGLSPACLTDCGLFPPLLGLVSCWFTGLNWFIGLSAAHQCQQEVAGRGGGLGWIPPPAASASLGIGPALPSHHTLRQKSKGHFSYSQDRCLDR